MQKSVLGISWEEKYVDASKLQYIQKYFGVDHTVAHILASKNVELGDIENFLNPRVKNHIIDPFHLHDMDKAVVRTIEAISKKQKVCIFADYDVDGASSGALLKNLFENLGLNPFIYVPDRFGEGYGPSIEAFHKFKQQNVELIITVDCGTHSHDAIQYANDSGIDVIVIDHHISSEELPPAAAIINPNRLDQDSEYRYLCGVGVAFIFSIALIKSMKELGMFTNIHEPNLLQYLDLVALGTVCDVMPLIGLNRAFVSQGIKVINQRNNIGISALMDIAGIAEPVNYYHIGFIIGPRINAGGRIGKSDLGASILSTKDKNLAKHLSIELDRHNTERKLMQETMFAEVYNEATSQAADRSIIVIVKDNWHSGVIGIIAGKLKEQLHKPVIVISVIDNVGKASCRSITGVDLGSKIVNAYLAGLLISGGGHAMAAGFSINANKISDFINYINQHLELEVQNALIQNQIQYYDTKIYHNAVNIPFIQNILQLGPFGPGNHAPMVLIENLKIKFSKIVGRQHVSCILVAQNNKHITAIAFNCINNAIGQTLLGYYKDPISVVGILQISYFNGIDTPQVVIHDLIV